MKSCNCLNMTKTKNDNYDFDICEMIDIIRQSSSYEEFCIKCDMNNIEVIIDKNEFLSLKSFYRS